MFILVVRSFVCSFVRSFSQGWFFSLPCLCVQGPFLYGDVTDYRTLEKIVIDRGIDVIIHNASLLSGAGEKNPKV